MPGIDLIKADLLAASYVYFVLTAHRTLFYFTLSNSAHFKGVSKDDLDRAHCIQLHPREVALEYC